MSKNSSAIFGACPLPVFEHKQIVLGHGSGGKLTADLIEKIFLPAFANPVLEKLDDQAVLQVNGSRLAPNRLRSFLAPCATPRSLPASRVKKTQILSAS